MPHGAAAAVPATAPPSCVPASFAAKKSQILAHLGQPEEEYADNSPKGTVDAQIRDLIDEINGYDGFVTTSSCAGRVAVFVEGPRSEQRGGGGGGARKRDGKGEGEGEADSHVETRVGKGGGRGGGGNSTSTSPGGKGGGRWLYVSHDPVPMPTPTHIAGGVKKSGTPRAAKSADEQEQEEEEEQEQEYFSSLFHLNDPSLSSSASQSPSHSSSCSTASPSPQLIHLSFSPLILHIHCATLRHARPLLAAAVNAGFRESGVQSLRALDDVGHGVMVAGTTAHPEGRAGEVVHRLVSEEYLALCAGVVNERFAANVERRERFRRELKSAMERDGLGGGPGPQMTEAAATGERSRGTRSSSGWEDKDERRRRKRDEGLERQKIMNEGATTRNNTTRQRGHEQQQQQQQLEEIDQDLTALGFD
ncbi:hypothetical protein AYL99_09040 [Fonsecaea erecta]|uniref:tRNA(Phe) 7-[(3-amino-3-carboxypropyl)-4-demethylwyosine(37)-N(4)]-methyltransferase n=1 Tax=Fonsecaea erecta TaxID=1367422 RepID=A0A178ZAY0_9EURO|nr:hypothetical protein AYL99_09040 [Fonsecaea erecta]OAP56928.1 hypothetical protein AYL99_09040 [Fonsecaea erecta]